MRPPVGSGSPPVRQELDEPNHLGGLDREDGALVRELNGRGEDGAKLPGDGLERLARDLGRVTTRPEAASPRGRIHELGDDDRGRRPPVKLAARLAGDDLGLEAVEDERGLDRGAVDLRGDALEPLDECRLEDIGGRLDLGAEPQPDPLEPSERKERVTALHGLSAAAAQFLPTPERPAGW